MPEGLQAGLSLQEFTDLIEYLATLHQPESTLASNHGMPGVIPELAKPVIVRPFFTKNFKLPRGKGETGLTSFHQVPGSNVFLVLHQKGMIWGWRRPRRRGKIRVRRSQWRGVPASAGRMDCWTWRFTRSFARTGSITSSYQVFEEGKVATRIVEKTFAADFKGDSGKPARRLLKIASVAEDHSGGCLQFGPDGFLYIVMGDTGPHNDPNGHAQNLRHVARQIAAHRRGSHGRRTGLCNSQPTIRFVGRPDARPEIWAYGFRNPWRFSFDRVTGDLWLADVGQDRVEEVDIVHRGENYGWNVYEGFEPFSNQYRKEGRTFATPVFAYRRKYGNSVTGGYVYRGDKHSSFYGVYMCGDYNSKRIFGVTQEDGALEKVRQIGTFPQRLVSFSTDEAGNIYARRLRRHDLPIGFHRRAIR